MAALLMPAPALAADPPAVTTGDGSATLLVVLLLGSLTAGLFFASPLRRRFRRASALSTRMPPALAESAAATSLERLASAVHGRLERATRRWPRLETETPLPPMLGGDIFFDADDRPAVTAQARQSAARSTAPWSTASVSRDERYLPLA